MAKLKRNYIQLVESVDKNGEVKVQNYLTPHFIPASMWYEAVDVLEDVENMEKEFNDESKKNKKSMSQMMKDQIDLLMNTVVKIYDNQFTKEDLLKKYHAPDIAEGLNQQVMFVAMGQQDDETKKFVESIS